jgi:histone deacetylase 6
LNVPLPAGQTDGVYLRAFAELVVPKLTQFQPDLVLVSAGFDAHAGDPIGQMQLTPAAFAGMTFALAEWCRAHHRPGPVLVLEGGYSLPALADSVRACLETLLGAPPPAVEAIALPLFAALRERHGL